MKKQYITVAAIAVLALVATFAFGAPAQAAEASGNIALTNKLVDRGVVARDDVTASLDLRIKDVVIDGVFLTTKLATTDMTSTSLALRSEFGVGYAVELGGFDLAGSVTRLDNTAMYADAYNAARVEAGYSFGKVRPYAFAERALTAAADDSYMGAGVEWQATDRLALDLAAYGYRYDSGSTKFNHADLTASYNLIGSLDAFGTYTYGGEDAKNRSLKDSMMVGVALRF